MCIYIYTCVRSHFGSKVMIPTCRHPAPPNSTHARSPTWQPTHSSLPCRATHSSEHCGTRWFTTMDCFRMLPHQTMAHPIMMHGSLCKQKWTCGSQRRWQPSKAALCLCWKHQQVIAPCALKPAPPSCACHAAISIARGAC